MSVDIDIVVVFHAEHNKALALQGLGQLLDAEDPARWRWIPVDNRKENRGFAKGCNYGARQGSAPVIGFLNPDVEIKGPFIDLVIEALSAPDVVIAGNRFGKPDEELRYWGVRHFVVGATFFVRRDWYRTLGGFDERYEWSHEELDMIRTTETRGLQVAELDLPLRHQSPSWNTPEDAEYKRTRFDTAAAAYRAKWGRP